MRILERSCLIVCTRNRAQELVRLLDCLLFCTGLPKQIVCVDSSDGSATRLVIDEYRRRFEFFSLVYVTAQPGLTRQRNLGLTLVELGVEFVHFLDDDVTVDPRYFEEIEHVFDSGGDICGVGGRITNVAPHRPSLLGALAGLSGPEGSVLFSGIAIICSQSTTTREVQWLSGCSMSYRLESIAGLKFDETRLGYALGEDVDFSLRAGGNGRLVWEPRATLAHLQPARDPLHYFKVAREGVRHRWELSKLSPTPVRKWGVIYSSVTWAVGGFLISTMRLKLREAIRYRASVVGLTDLLFRRGITS